MSIFSYSTSVYNIYVYSIIDPSSRATYKNVHQSSAIFRRCAGRYIGAPIRFSATTTKKKKNSMYAVVLLKKLELTGQRIYTREEKKKRDRERERRASMIIKQTTSLRERERKRDKLCHERTRRIYARGRKRHLQH